MEQVNDTIVTDAKINEKWQSMIKVFKAITDSNPPVEKVREKLVALKESATNTALLTPRQREGITDRCNNYLNGTYGVNSIKEEYMKNNQQK